MLAKSALAVSVHVQNCSMLCFIAVHMVVSKALRERKATVSEFLAAVRKVNNLHWSNEDFGDFCHTALSEPYFYDQSYAACATPNTPIPVKQNGTCLVAAGIRA